MDATTLTGECLCGAVQFRFSGTPLVALNCHCADCRSATGTGFATNVIVRVSDLDVSGAELATFRIRGDSGNLKTNYFRQTCGSPLFSENEARPGVLAIRVGELKDAGQIHPQMNLYTAGALDFSPVDTSLTEFAGMPDRNIGWKVTSGAY